MGRDALHKRLDPALGSGQPDKAVAVRLIGGETWELTVDLDRSPGCASDITTS